MKPSTNALSIDATAAPAFDDRFHSGRVERTIRTVIVVGGLGGALALIVVLGAALACIGRTCRSCSRRLW